MFCSQEVDFFQDMEPVISSPRTLLLPGDEGEVGSSDQTPLVTKPEPPSPLVPRQDKFKVEGEEAEEGGWGDDEFLEWGGNDEESKPMTEVAT